MSEPKRLKYEPTEVDYSEVQRVRDRFCKLMGWKQKSHHKFDVIRQTLSGKAIVVSCEKAQQIAELIESLEKQIEMARAKLDEIVVGDGVDAGVILLSHEIPTDWDAERQVHVYRHEHFSPLGDALVGLHNILIKKAPEERQRRE